jgi:hypothetical protein
MVLTACGVEVFDLMSYLPDSFIPRYEEIRDTLLSWLKKFGILHEDGAAGMNYVVTWITPLGLSHGSYCQRTHLVHVRHTRTPRRHLNASRQKKPRLRVI